MQSASDEATRAEGAASPPPAAARRRTPLLLASLVAVAALASGGWYVLTRGQESTDDAEVEGRVMNVSPRVSGLVLHVHVADNQVVNAGDVLVELDPADYAARADGARADLAAARASFEGARAALALTEKTAPASLVQARGGMVSAASSAVSAEAAVAQMSADIVAAESRKTLAERNLQRARSLLEQHAVAVAEVDASQTDFDSANAQLEQARARLASAQAALAGSGGGIELAKGRLEAAQTSREQVDAARAALSLAEARVQQMEAALKLAELNLSYTTVRATRRGVVSRRTVEEGQTVSPERPLFAIVPLDDVWIVANFKEDQLADMSPGEPATVRLDTYGRPELRGRVESIAGGTGARFALLPPDNATGNFVKVVQRLPVLIRLDPANGIELRPGMSADVTVRTAKP
jgi:membrane fusion protein (multidrug efflux system)